MKRVLSLILCFLTVCSLLTGLISCATGEPETEQTDAQTVPDGAESEQETTDPAYTCDLPALDYGQAELTVIYLNRDGRSDEMYTDKYGSGALSDAVYERNIAVERQLGVKMLFTSVDANLISEVERDIKGHTGAIDIVVNGTSSAVNPAISGEYLDLSRLENINLSKHYWTQGYNDMVTYTENRRQFLATGSMALSLFRFTYLTIYNKTVFDNMHETDLYEIVLNKKWTLDYQNNLITGHYVDLDGDSKRSDGDFYGFVTGTCVSVDPYMVATDCHLIVRDPDTGDWIFNEDALAPLTDIADKTRALYKNEATYTFDGASSDDTGLNNIVKCFARGNSMTATIMFWNMEHCFDELASMTYGIAPIPKFNEEQENYYTYVQDQVSCFGLSAGVAGGDTRREMLAAVLESLAYNSYVMVRPAYYDISLSSRYMQDPESKVILDLMFDSLSFDFSSSCGNLISGCVMRDNLRSVLSTGSGNAASTAKTWSRSVTTKLKDINKKMKKVNKADA